MRCAGPLGAVQFCRVPVFFIKGIKAWFPGIFMVEFPVLNFTGMKLESCAVKVNESSETKTGRKAGLVKMASVATEALLAI